MHIVHTRGFGLDRTGVGSGWIRHVSGTSQCLHGLESGSSPTSGTCFPCSGACWPLSVQKLFTCGPVGAFLLVAVVLAGVRSSTSRLDPNDFTLDQRPGLLVGGLPSG